MLRTFLNMFFQKFIKTFLFHILEYTYSIWYINYIRNNRPQGVDLDNRNRNATLSPVKV